MWFKNLALYRFTEDFKLTPEQLNEKLEAMPFRPCSAHQESSFGWTSPLPGESGQLVHAINGFMMICGKKQEKVLPTPVVNELLREKIQEKENDQGRKLSKKERTAIKDEIYFELLPKAFCFSKTTYAYIDSQNGWLIVDSASAKKAEDLLSHLRKCLGSLPVTLPTTKAMPSNVLTHWLINKDFPEDITIENECELRSVEEEASIIRCKRQDLSLPEIINHLDNGKQVLKLAMTWADRLSFVIDDTLSVKRLRFLDLIQDQFSDHEAADEYERFDAEFSIMAMELANFLPRLMQMFGGEKNDNV